MAHDWLTDRRDVSIMAIRRGEQRYDIKATPIPNGHYALTCKQLPGFRGSCAYVGDDPRNNMAFQFVMSAAI